MMDRWFFLFICIVLGIKLIIYFADTYDCKIGETRIRKAFLIFPRTIHNEMRWLEIVSWEEEFHVSSSSIIDSGGGVGYWESLRWIDAQN